MNLEYPYVRLKMAGNPCIKSSLCYFSDYSDDSFENYYDSQETVEIDANNLETEQSPDTPAPEQSVRVHLQSHQLFVDLQENAGFRGDL